MRPRRRPARRAPDRHELYERCAQSPARQVALLRAIHGGEPRVLAEDFCGTGAVSRAWVEAAPRARAVASDRDRAVIARLARCRGVRAVHADVLARPPNTRADIVFVGNFSIGEIHERSRLIRYLRRSRTRLKPRGVFVCDLYGGETAFQTGRWTRSFPGPGDTKVRYTWEQRTADPLTGMVENAMHFRVTRGRTRVCDLADAFTYRWRLWSMTELTDALHEAGFRNHEILDAVPGALDADGRAYPRAITSPADLEPSYVVLICARVA